MITAENLENCAAKLYTYDVTQGAWEQEPNGFEANATHVLTHLSKSLVGKNFSDAGTVQFEIAPDSMQYALRLARWGDVDVRDLIDRSFRWPLDTDNGTGFIVARSAHRLGGMSEHAAAFAEAAGSVADNLHDLGHASTQEQALARRSYDMGRAGSMLISCANIGAEMYDFDLVEAFDYRLTDLRERFGIPNPEETTPEA